MSGYNTTVGCIKWNMEASLISTIFSISRIRKQSQSFTFPFKQSDSE